jgi:membrane protein implicated in regulation of membrane protease activity
MSLNWNWVLVVGGAVLILLEVALGGFAGFDLVLIGSSFLVGGGLGLLLGNTSVGLFASAILCLAYVAGGRRWVRARMHHSVVPSNTDALIGLRGVVTVRVSNHEPGQVRVRQEIWRAVPVEAGAGPYEPGVEVTVAGVDGVTLQVR